MIPFLRLLSLLANTGILVGVPLLCGLPPSAALSAAVLLFSVSWWACARNPHREVAEPEVCLAAARAARSLDASAPRYVHAVPGWTAAAVRAGRGYGLLLGREVAPDHRAAVFTHEIAHFVTGDLFWEPFTDGPARLLLEFARRFPPLWLVACPFLVFAAPLARATELRADRVAAARVAGYADVLGAVADKMAGESVLYPSVRERIRNAT